MWGKEEEVKRRIEIAALAGLLIFLPTALLAGTYEIDPAHSSVEFAIRHLGISKVKGGFGEFSGTIEFDNGQVEIGSAEVAIKTASIDTGNKDRDNHLRSPDFFEVEKYPEILFKSTGVEKTDDGYTLHGKLTIHGVEKHIHIPFEVLGVVKDHPMLGTRVGFEGKVELKREDYNVGWEAVKYRPPLIGNGVTVTLNLEAALKE